MRKPFIIGLILALGITYGAMAQAPEFNIKVTPTEADIIWKGLRKLPVEEVEGLMAKIRSQFTEQTTPKPVEQPKKD